MRLIERRDCTTDLIHKSYMLVDACDEKSERDLVEKLPALHAEWAAFAAEKGLPHVHIKSPYHWSSVNAQLEAEGYRAGYYFWEKPVVPRAQLPRGIERVYDAFKIEDMIREQQRLHVEFDPDFFESLETFDLKKYIQDFQNVLDRNEGALFVAKVGEACIAHIALAIGKDKKQMILYELFVDAAHRREGLGRTLIEAAMYYCASSAVNSLMTTVAAKNTRGQAFYASCGFQPRAKLFYK